MEAHRDRALAEMVRHRLLSDQRLSGQCIAVTASAGYVQLIGSVGSEDLKRLASELAKGITGVRGVENRLDISSSCRA